MHTQRTQKISPEFIEINEKLRKDVMKSIEPYGVKSASDLDDMSEAERSKWLFWNLHENLNEIRQLEPTLIAQVIRTQLSVSDGQSMWDERSGPEKRVSLICKWHLLLKYAAYQNEEAFPISQGWIDLFIGNAAPAHPALQDKQKGFLDADNPLYPNQLYLYGWVSEYVWQEIKSQLYQASPHTHTEIYLRDNAIFPVKSDLNFVTGPTGSLGITNLEFLASSSPRMYS